MTDAATYTRCPALSLGRFLSAAPTTFLNHMPLNRKREGAVIIFHDMSEIHVDTGSHGLPALMPSDWISPLIHQQRRRSR